MTAARRPAIVLLGGGMGALSAAWELSAPGWRSRFESITLYQRGAQLGGKAASSRGIYGRIEEHGLHVWMGYYDNAFRLVQECYGELDRAVTDPSCPIRGWREGFIPSSRLGVSEPKAPGLNGWVADLKQNDRTPGGDAQSGFADDLPRRLLEGVDDALRSILDGTPSRELMLSASPTPPGPHDPQDHHLEGRH